MLSEHRGYFADAVTEAIQASGATAHIPSRSNVRIVRSVDRELYRSCNLVKRFFNRLKHFRGIATDISRPQQTSSPQSASPSTPPDQSYESTT